MPTTTDNPHSGFRQQGLPVPLFWQITLSAYAAGIFCLRSPAAAAMFLWLVWQTGATTRKTLSAVLLAAAFGLGAGHGWIQLPNVPAIPDWVGHSPKVTVSAIVDELEGKPDNRLRVLLKNVRCTLPDGRTTSLPGRMVWTWQYPAFRPAPGQTVTLRAKVTPVRGFINPEGWDTRFHWRCRNVFFRAYTRGEKADIRLTGQPDNPRSWSFRQHLRQVMLQSPASPGRGLLLALLTGDRSDLHASTVDVLRQASLSHSLALSGLHLGIAASLGFLLASLLARLRPSILLRLPRPKLGVVLAAPMVLAYVWLGGASPSLLRAAVMFSCFGLLLLFDRPRVLLDGLFLALGLILAVSPLSVFDLGLQMSFLAVAGIAALASPLRTAADRLFGTPGKKNNTPWFASRGAVLVRTAALWIFGLIGCSLAANIALLPVNLEAFGRIPLGLWWNALWLPILGLAAMPLGFLGLLLTSLPDFFGLHAPASAIFSLDAALLDAALDLLRNARTTGLMPVAAGVHPGWTVILGYYLFCLLCLGWLQNRKAPGLSRLALALCLLAWPVAVQGWQNLHGAVRLTVLDVGQGQALLVEHSGRKVLIDGGGTFSRTFDIGEAVIAPAVSTGTGPRLRAIALSHAQRDHSGGLLYPMAALPVDSLLLGDGQPLSKDLEKLQHLARKRGIPMRRMTPGQTVDLGQGVRLRCLYPPQGRQFPDPNDCSLTFLLEWNRRGLAMLPGDLSAAPLRDILKTHPGLSFDILILPHHGSDTGACPELYDVPGIQTAIASCGAYNRYDFPGPGVRRALHEKKIPVYSTGTHGAVRVIWDSPQTPARIFSMERAATH